jgi:hypothetical protein
MNIKNHPEYWVAHKEIYQEESDNLDPLYREIVINNPDSTEAKLFARKIDNMIERKLRLKLISIELGAMDKLNN